MAVDDHSIRLLMAIEAQLKSVVPLDGGWHSTRLEEAERYPLGYIDLTVTRRVGGQAYFREEHEGVISVYHRAERTQAVSPYEAFQLSRQAFKALDGGFPSLIPGFEITQFSCGELRPRNDGATWGRLFTFTAITHEVTNG